MNTKRFFIVALIMTFGFSVASYQGQTQDPTKKHKNQPVTSATSSTVQGSGTVGRLSKWVGVGSSSTYVLGDSNIFEDKFGKVGMGTTTPTSPLTVQGIIETTLGGFKFPDGTVQTTSAEGALVTVQHDNTLKGNGTSAAPLGVASPLEVRDRDNPARQPVSFRFLGPFTVPAGKRLVIEYVSGFFNRPTTPDLQPMDQLSIITAINSEGGNHYVLGYRTHIGTSETSYHVAQNMRIYADPGTQVDLFGTSPTSVASIRFDGYFVDMP